MAPCAWRCIACRRLGQPLSEFGVASVGRMAQLASGILALKRTDHRFRSKNIGQGAHEAFFEQGFGRTAPPEFDPKRAQAARRARILSREQRPCQGGLRSGCPQALRGDGRRQHGRAEAMPAADNAQSLLTIPVAVAELLAGAVARKGASLVVGKAASDKCRRFCYLCQ